MISNVRFFFCPRLWFTPAAAAKGGKVRRHKWRQNIRGRDFQLRSQIHSLIFIILVIQTHQKRNWRGKSSDNWTGAAVWHDEEQTDGRTKELPELTLGLLLLVTTAFLTGHSVALYVRSFAPLSPLTRSAVLRFATLTLLAHSIHRLAHSLCPLPHGTVEIPEYVFTL